MSFSRSDERPTHRKNRRLTGTNVYSLKFEKNGDSIKAKGEGGANARVARRGKGGQRRGDGEVKEEV